MPVSLDITVVSGCRTTHSAQVVSSTGKKSSLMPLSASGPTTGSPVNWCHRVLAARSYISLLLLNSRPDVPKVVGSPFILAEYTIPVPQSVQ
jgi:hypothetical protein